MKLYFDSLLCCPSIIYANVLHHNMCAVRVPHLAQYCDNRKYFRVKYKSSIWGGLHWLMESWKLLTLFIAIYAKLNIPDSVYDTKPISSVHLSQLPTYMNISKVSGVYIYETRASLRLQSRAIRPAGCPFVNLLTSFEFFRNRFPRTPQRKVSQLGVMQWYRLI